MNMEKKPQENFIRWLDNKLDEKSFSSVFEITEWNKKKIIQFSQHSSLTSLATEKVFLEDESLVAVYFDNKKEKLAHTYTHKVKMFNHEIVFKMFFLALPSRYQHDVEGISYYCPEVFYLLSWAELFRKAVSWYESFDTFRWRRLESISMKSLFTIVNQ